MKQARAKIEQEGQQVIDQVSNAVKDGLKRKIGADEAEAKSAPKKVFLGGSMFAQLGGESSSDDDGDDE